MPHSQRIAFSLARCLRRSEPFAYRGLLMAFPSSFRPAGLRMGQRAFASSQPFASVFLRSRHPASLLALHSHSRSFGPGAFRREGGYFPGGIKNPRMFPCREKVIEAARRAQRRNPSRKVHKVDDAGEEENVLGAALHRLAFSALPMVSVYRIKQ